MDSEQAQPEETQTGEPAEVPEQEKPAEETPEGEPAETKPEEPAEAKDAAEGEGDADEEDESEGTPEQKEERRKRGGGWSRKRDKLRMENEWLKEQLMARGAQPPQQPTQPAKEKTADEKVFDMMKSVAAQALAEQKERERAEQANADFLRKQREFAAKHPDYDDAIDSVRHIGVPNEHLDAILTSDDPAAIMYALAKAPDELARIARLPLAKAERELGRLEAKLASVAAVPKAQPKSAARPPAPPTTVGGKASSARNLDDLPISEYKRAFRSKGR